MRLWWRAQAETPPKGQSALTHRDTRTKGEALGPGAVEFLGTLLGSGWCSGVQVHSRTLGHAVCSGFEFKLSCSPCNLSDKPVTCVSSLINVAPWARCARLSWASSVCWTRVVPAVSDLAARCSSCRRMMRVCNSAKLTTWACCIWASSVR